MNKEEITFKEKEGKDLLYFEQLIQNYSKSQLAEAIIDLQQENKQLKECIIKLELENKVLKEQMVAMVQPNYTYGIRGDSNEL